MRRREVEEAEESPAEIIVGFRRFVLGGLLLEFLVAIERIELTLELFRIGKFAAGFENAILRTQCRGVRACRFGHRTVRRADSIRRSVGRPRGLRDLQTGHEAFEIALLFWL